ncbi:DUF134 domain-containing protein [Prosthecochloris sp. SCSIO W1101]|uniref:DUF134 domain-containing protein n=1 Tax=Prosthecochloris sp. SCSIO W1101 TaxID=2992242 RepID=UPI00223DE889|nr:DUF134 domain-containing protein [Prosthecochloris sp. SCSIO W1101]UZJ42680.1 DUF134 domain-containing protein [Prosthecochloris sp. SCSIO W1101]
MVARLRRQGAGRPKSCRRVEDTPRVRCFKPQNTPRSQLEEVVVTVDELEAIRLADLERLYQAEAAEKMHVSRQTFGRILESAHKKVAEAFVYGKSIVFEGGVFMKSEETSGVEKELCLCPKCGYEAEHNPGVPCRSMKCSECGATMIRKGGCGVGRREGKGH